MPPTFHGVPVPQFRVELSDFQVANGVDTDLKPFNFGHAATVAGGSRVAGKVVMTAPVDEDKAVQLFATTDVIVFADGGVVHVKPGATEGDFTADVADVLTSTDVTVIATFKSFFPAPAKTVTLHLTPGPPS